MLPSYFDYIFVHLRQKVLLKPELSPKFLSTLGPNPNPTRKARATYNSERSLFNYIVASCQPVVGLLLQVLQYHVQLSWKAKFAEWYNEISPCLKIFFGAIKEDEEFDECLDTLTTQHLQPLKTVLKQYFPELKEQEAAFV